MEINVKLKERFYEKWDLNTQTGCWEWNASFTPNGYGQIKRTGERRQIPAHRLSYEIHYGEIPEGMFVCHSCDNRKCVKPSHLFLGTAKDNMIDMAKKRRHRFGESGHRAKLTDDKVRQIHRLAKTGLFQREIGKMFGVAQGTIGKILSGKKWKHIYTQMQSKQVFI